MWKSFPLVFVCHTAVNAVVVGEKSAVIKFHAARGSGVGIGICVSAFPFPVGGLHSRAAASADFEQKPNKQAKDAKDNPNYTPATAACVVVSVRRTCI